MCEDGTAAEFEDTGFGVEDHDAGDVAWQEVWGELHASEWRHALTSVGKAIAESFCESRFSASWEVFE